MHTRKLRDAVHGDIHLTDAEVALLDTPQMQRLRGIRQLGATYYVYPSAHHTRFEHCLGACWMAKAILERAEADGGLDLPPVERQAICLAALVHDVTHIPFGHTFEDERRLLPRHDRSPARFDMLLGDTELGERMRASEAGRLALEVLRPGGELPPERRYVRDVVSGTICADLLDYLKRDNYFCGLSYEFDERLFHYFRVEDGRLVLDLHRGGLLRRDALTEITNLLRIRYVLSERVYYHHAKIAAGVMVSKAVERALRAGLTERELCTLTDGSLVHSLPQRFPDDPALCALVDRFRNRALFKRCYMASRRIGEEAVEEAVRCYHLNEDGARDETERHIAEELGARPHQVALYCAPSGMALKEADVPVTMPDGRMEPLSSLNTEEIRVLQNQHKQLWRLYTFISPDAPGQESAGKVCEHVIGHPNELPAERSLDSEF
ncbi:MAG: HD domain-containing protein [Candidatus Brocadiia bacterium]